MIRPQPRSIIPGAKTWHSRNGAYRLTDMTSCHDSSETVCQGSLG